MPVGSQTNVPEKSPPDNSQIGLLKVNPGGKRKRNQSPAFIGTDIVKVRTQFVRKPPREEPSFSTISPEPAAVIKVEKVKHYYLCFIKN